MFYNLHATYISSVPVLTEPQVTSARDTTLYGRLQLLEPARLSLVSLHHTSHDPVSIAIQYGSPRAITRNI